MIVTQRRIERLLARKIAKRHHGAWKWNVDTQRWSGDGAPQTWLDLVYEIHDEISDVRQRGTQYAKKLDAAASMSGVKRIYQHICRLLSDDAIADAIADDHRREVVALRYQLDQVREIVATEDELF